MLSPLYGQLSPLRVPTTDIAMLTVNAYIASVEAADGQALEEGVKSAYTNFIVGCHNDGILSAIKASCILAGARTITGALVPLVGNAPTPFSFVSADYNRKLGLKGNGTTKRLLTNRIGSADPQNNRHMSVYRGEAITATQSGVNFMGSGTVASFGSNLINYHATGATNGYVFKAAQASTGGIVANNFTGSAGFVGVSRSISTSANYRAPGNQSGTLSVTSGIQSTHGMGVFCLMHSGSPGSYTNNRLSFYSQGEFLNLAALDTRVSNLMTALAAAIP